jgi:hypothetical protein
MRPAICVATLPASAPLCLFSKISKPLSREAIEHALMRWVIEKPKFNVA